VFDETRRRFFNGGGEACGTLAWAEREECPSYSDAVV
jgi:hypothetical protein